MEQEKSSFQIPNNNFENCASEFVYHTTLKTTAHLTRPNYPKVSVATNGTDTKVLGIKTSQNVMQVIYKNGEFKDHKKVLVDDERLEKQVMVAFTFKSHVFSPTNSLRLIIGYRSGLVSYIDCRKEKVLGLYNCDEKEKAVLKTQPVSLLAVLPKPNEDEIIVIFEDSTAMRYKLGTQSQNLMFVEKIKKFEAKTSFNRSLNRFKHKSKTKETIYRSGFLTEGKPEFHNFYAVNLAPAGQNPVAYYKFNHRTISDFTVKRHKSFTKTLWKDSREEEMTVFALTSLDGYLVIFDLKTMRPLLSYRGAFGGVNSLCFNETCELVALGGQDDHITVLDLNTMTALLCEGHKSFVSRAIFHTISEKKEKAIEGDDKNGKSTTSKTDEGGNGEYVRIIGGGMDASLSFWEFKRSIFGNNKWLRLNESQYPIQLQYGRIPEPQVIKPLHMEHVVDAIGWIDLCENMLIQGGYDGGISTYIIRDVVVPSPPRKSKELDSEVSDEVVRKKGQKESPPVERGKKKEEKEREPPAGVSAASRKKKEAVMERKKSKEDNAVDRKKSLEERKEKEKASVVESGGEKVEERKNNEKSNELQEEQGIKKYEDSGAIREEKKVEEEPDNKKETVNVVETVVEAPGENIETSQTKSEGIEANIGENQEKIDRENEQRETSNVNETIADTVAGNAETSETKQGSNEAQEERKEDVVTENLEVVEPEKENKETHEESELKEANTMNGTTAEVVEENSEVVETKKENNEAHDESEQKETAGTETAAETMVEDTEVVEAKKEEELLDREQQSDDVRLNQQKEENL